MVVLWWFRGFYVGLVMSRWLDLVGLVDRGFKLGEVAGLKVLALRFEFSDLSFQV